MTSESLWIDGWCNPSLAPEELRVRELQPLNILANRKHPDIKEDDARSNDDDADNGDDDEEAVVFCDRKMREKRSAMSKVKASNQKHQDIREDDPLSNDDVDDYGEDGDEAVAFGNRKMREKRSAMSKVKASQEKEEKCQRRREELLGLSNNNLHECQQVPRLLALLKVCVKQKDLHTGSRIHADIVQLQLLEKDVFLGSALVSMYAKCGALMKAQEVFDGLPVRNAVSWSALIAAFTQCGHGDQALKSFQEMQHQGFSPDAVTFVSILKACGSIGASDEGAKIHIELARTGLLKKNIIVGTALVDMYAKCGLLAKAQRVFDELPVRNVVTWSALLAGYAQHGHSEQALMCFEQMKLEGMSPNAITFVSILKACGSMGAADKGKELHADIVRRGLLKTDVVVGTALVDMYAKCGLLARAQEVFEELPVRNVVSWSALIDGYAQHGHGQQALECFERMQLEGHYVDVVTFVCMLKACSSIGAADKGKEIHAEVVRRGLLQNNSILGTALVDMYARCGLLAEAQDVFDKLPVRCVVSWSALMAGYALLGKAKNVFQLFDKMIEEGIKPNFITFTTLLNVCSHNGLIDKGQMYFQAMSVHYGIIPTLEHCTCMVDLFARAGHLDKAVAVIKGMLLPADLKIWLTLLSACRKWGNVKLGRLAFEHVVQLDEMEDAAYVCMSNIYAAAGRLKDAESVEVLRAKNLARKSPEGH